MLRFDAIPEPVKELLCRLSGLPVMRDFALGGGTSLALRFGHRLSVGLDFFAVGGFSPEVVFEELGVRNSVVVGRASNSLRIDADGVKLDLRRHSYRLLESIETFETVALLSLPDVAAMKLNAIANRGSKKDFYDLCELLKHFQLTELIGFFSGKYPATDPFTVIRSLAWFEDADGEPDPVSLIDLEWEDVKSKVAGAVSSL